MHWKENESGLAPAISRAHPHWGAFVAPPCALLRDARTVGANPPLRVAASYRPPFAVQASLRHMPSGSVELCQRAVLVGTGACAPGGVPDRSVLRSGGGAAVAFVSLEPSANQHMARDHAVHHPQHRCHQHGRHGGQFPQRQPACCWPRSRNWSRRCCRWCSAWSRDICCGRRGSRLTKVTAAPSR